MTFREYRKKMGWTLEEAARFLGSITASSIARHEIGRCMPRADELAAYEKLSNGEVAAQDFIAQRQLYRADPLKARKRVGARKLERARA
jgi:transcriptional regulator with XRE-family HTH domain